MKLHSLLFLMLALSGTAGAATDAPWPHFGGPNRDNRSPETGLLKAWPEGGPKLLWKSNDIGFGHAAVAIAEGRIYTAGEINKETVITALDMDGRLLWQAKNGAWTGVNPPGARGTPTWAGGKLYHMNSQLQVVCLDAATGKQIWAADLRERFGGRTIRWALAESLVVDGPRVIATPGGERAGMVALDKETGKTVWTCEILGDKPSYTTPTIVEWQGLRQIVTMTANYAVGVAAETGKLLWTFEHKVPYEANCNTPLFDNGVLYLSGTWGRGTTALRLKIKDGACTAEEAWRTAELDNEHGGIVLHDGHLYGQADGNHKQRHWACLDAATGKTAYSVPGLPTDRSGNTFFADGMLYVTTDLGAVALVQPDPKAFRAVSQFQIPGPVKKNFWAFPVVCGGRLYLRYGETLYCHAVQER